MKRLIFLCLTISFAAVWPVFAQGEIRSPDDAAKRFDLNVPATDEADATWFDLARKIFPDLRADNSFSRSISLRFSPEHNVRYEIQKPTRIVGAQSRSFADGGRRLTAAIFELENLERRSGNAVQRWSVLVIYGEKPNLDVIEADDARLSGYLETELSDDYWTLAAPTKNDAGETLHLIYRRRLSGAPDAVEEKHRFLMLEKNSLRVVFDSPVLVNKSDCGGIVENSLSADHSAKSESDFPVYRFTYVRSVTPNEDCPNQKYYGVTEVETYRMDWDARRGVFRQVPVERGGYLTGAWGTYDPAEYENYPHDATRLKISVGYRAQGIYDRRTGEVRLAAPGKTPRGTIVEYEFEDYWGVSPTEVKRTGRGTIKFQITDEKTVFLSGNRRRTVYHCLLYAFGKRSRFDESRDPTPRDKSF